MDWEFAIKRKRRELAAIVATLLAMVVRCVSRDGRSAVLRIVRPAESALRRLIVIYAREIGVAGRTARPSPLPDFSRFERAGPNRAPAFRLIDPRKRFDDGYDDGAERGHEGAAPRIWTLGMATPSDKPVAIAPEVAPDLASIKRRIAALDHALKTLPTQARRLSRLTARRQKAPPGPGRVGPIRPGRPPGYRQRPAHDVDDILADCHALVVGEVVWPPP